MNVYDIAYRDPLVFGTEEIERTRRSRFSLVVPQNFAAVDAVRVAELNEIGIICVVGPGTQRPVEGLVVLDWVSDRLRRKHRADFALLSEALLQAEEGPLGIAQYFPDQFLNLQRPDLRWCDNHSQLCFYPCTRP